MDYDTKAVANINILKTDIAIRISQAVTASATLMRFSKTNENPNYTLKAFRDFYEAFFSLFQETKWLLKKKKGKGHIVEEYNMLFEKPLNRVSPEELLMVFDKYSCELRNSGLWELRFFNLPKEESWRKGI